jgi:predicted phage terminase large subunit-like protein
MPSGDLVLLGGRRDRIDPSRHAEAVQDLRGRWGADTVFVESRMFGTQLVYELGRAGVPVSELKADTDKYTRALPAAARAESGLLWLPDPDVEPWVGDWVDELCGFPNASHDDVVDVVAYAARVVTFSDAPPDNLTVYDDDLGYERVSIGPAI